MMPNPPPILTRCLLLMAVILAVGLGLVVWRAAVAIPGDAGDAGHRVEAALAKHTVGADLPVGVFRAKPGSSSAAVPGHPLAQRFRLAGTFFMFGAGSSDENANRRAILDDVRQGAQFLVGEGDSLDDVQVVRVFEDHVVVRSGSEEVDLWLSFAGGAASSQGGLPSGPVSDEDAPALETSAFGKRINENRWIMKRQAILEYYQQLLDDPERIAALYMSMKPSYDAENAVRGYQVQPEGEQDFFKAVGLQQGDVIHKVNSMNMTSQRRAEYFIGEFVKNRVNAFVLDIERGGTEQKLIYLVR